MRNSCELNDFKGRVNSRFQSQRSRKHRDADAPTCEAGAIGFMKHHQCIGHRACGHSISGRVGKALWELQGREG